MSTHRFTLTELLDANKAMLTEHLTIPTVHLNGTSRQDLIDGYINAINALREAGKRLADTAPNGRDYYPQGGDAINAAMSEHTVRVHVLRSVLKELEHIVEHLT